MNINIRSKQYQKYSKKYFTIIPYQFSQNIFIVI